MERQNISVGVFTLPFSEGFIEEDGQIVPGLQSIKDFAFLITHHGHCNLKFFLPESGQLGVLTETGYHDGILGLMQEGKINLCFLPLPLDTQKAPGYFSPIISEENYYICSLRKLFDDTSPIVSSLSSVNTIPILLSILIVLLLESVVTKHLNIESIVTVVYRTFSISFYQNLSRHSKWFCFIFMIILMFPVFIFNASFNTQTIVGNNDAKIDTLRDIVHYDKSPIFIEGVSMYDLFKAKVTKSYSDVYEQAKAKGLGKPFELGPLPEVVSIKDSIAALISGRAKKLAPIVGSSSGYINPNQQIYFSERPFHMTLQAMLLSYELSSHSFIIKLKKLVTRFFESGIGGKIEDQIYVDFILSTNVFPVSKFDLFKGELSTKLADLNWKSLNYDGFHQLFYFYIAFLIIVTCIQLIEIIIFKLFYCTVLKKP